MNNFIKNNAASNGRAIGIIYLCYFLTAISALKFPKTESWYTIMNFISCGFYLALTIMFYFLFKPVNKIISMIAAIFSMLGCIATALYIINFIKVNPLIFFGPYCILVGYLIYKSIFLPHLLGFLMITAGLCWLVILTPFEKNFSLYIKIFGFLAELLLMLWLVIKGINNQKWKAQKSSEVHP